MANCGKIVTFLCLGIGPFHFLSAPPLLRAYFFWGGGGGLSKRKKNPEGGKKNSEGVKSFSSFSFYDLKNQKKKSSS